MAVDNWSAGNKIEKDDIVTALINKLISIKNARKNPYTKSGIEISNITPGTTPASANIKASEVATTYNTIGKFKNGISAPSSGTTINNLGSLYNITNTLANDTTGNTTCNG